MKIEMSPYAVGLVQSAASGIGVNSVMMSVARRKNWNMLYIS